MGWLKKLTKPISKVLDKIVPNEIKPFLPYAAAFAPYMMGPTAGAGLAGIGINNPMIQRAIMTGGLNLGSQLAQEGSEGEFSGLSLGLAGLQGALTAPGAADTLKGMQISGVDEAGNYVRAGDLAAMDLEAANALNLSSDLGMLGSAQDLGIRGAAGAAEFLGKGVDILGRGGTKPGLNLATLEAAALPVSQATGDLAEADARRALRDYENQMAADESMSLIDDDGRRRAIRAAMEAAGHLEEVIVETLGVLGLKQGGIVGLKKGGRAGYRLGEIVEEEVVTKDIEGQTAGMGNVMNLFQTPYGFDRDMFDAMYNDFLEDNRGMGLHNFAETWLGMVKKDTPKSSIRKGAQGGVASVLPKGREADYRGGGVIPVGSRERADDVPARLSKNEFVMTADAVRAAGGGSINKGAKRMYNLMHNLEARV